MSTNTADQAKKIRQGEELPQEVLQDFLQKELQLSGQLEVLQFPSGFSNLTYLLKLGEKEMVLRRPPFGAENIMKGHDMGREYKVLSLLQPYYDKAPKPLVYTEDKSIIGAPFYVMERVQGIILRANDKLDWEAGRIRQLNENFIDNLADLHNLDIEKTGLVAMGKPEGYVQRQVEGWCKRYDNAKTDEIGDMDYVMDWFVLHIPETKHNAFIHNDYKYDNVVLNLDDPTQIKAVLDWEMSTVGDQFTDFATMLAYTPEKTDPEYLRSFNVVGEMNREDILARYEEKVGKKVDNVVFHYAFALFKLGVIIQQIYYRYHKGYTQDPRFASLIQLVKDCALLSATAIRSGRIRGF